MKTLPIYDFPPFFQHIIFCISALYVLGTGAGGNRRDEKWEYMAIYSNMGFRGLIKEKGGGWGVTDRLIHVKQNI
jgi:hypothetical protein